MADPMTDGDLSRIETTWINSLGNRGGHYVPALVAEVRRLRGEHAAMLDVIEAAEGYLKLDLRCRTLDDAGRLADALDRVRTLIGDDDE